MELLAGIAIAFAQILIIYNFERLRLTGDRIQYKTETRKFLKQL